MFDWLIPLLIVAILLIWILDYLGLLDFLEVVAAVVSLIGAALVGTVKLLLRLVRHLAGSSHLPGLHASIFTAAVFVAAGQRPLSIAARSLRHRKRHAGKIKPDRADLVDRRRIGAAQVAGNLDRGVLVRNPRHRSPVAAPWSRQTVRRSPFRRPDRARCGPCRAEARRRSEQLVALSRSWTPSRPVMTAASCSGVQDMTSAST